MHHFQWNVFNKNKVPTFNFQRFFFFLWRITTIFVYLFSIYPLKNEYKSQTFCKHHPFHSHFPLMASDFNWTCSAIHTIPVYIVNGCLSNHTFYTNAWFQCAYKIRCEKSIASVRINGSVFNFEWGKKKESIFRYSCATQQSQVAN